MIQTLAIRRETLSRHTTKLFAILSLLLVLFSESFKSTEANNNNNNNVKQPSQQQQKSPYFQRFDSSGRPPLMVAIYCGDESSGGVGGAKSLSTLYHNQYLDVDSRKWRTDRDTSAFCTQDKQAVLNYCKKVYSNHDIRNIVESSRPYKIDNWCRLGASSKRRCRTRLVVRPYRCLEGTFQSDALLVPEKCVFDHVHNKSSCEGPDHWNRTATENCHSKNQMKLQSFAMLQPCGLDIFAGVEFVCCPTNNVASGAGAGAAASAVDSNIKPSTSVAAADQGSNSFAQASSGPKYDDSKLNNIKVDEDVSKGARDQSDSSDDQGNESQENEDDEDDYDEDETDEYDDDSSTWNGSDKTSSSSSSSSGPNSSSSSSTTSSTTTTTTTTTTTERPVDRYLGHFDILHERDDFRKAELAVESSYRDKITHVMREWSQLDGRYEEMKKRDPQAAEEFKNKMTHQFQKTIEALEEEGAAQRHQLASMHAERAMAIINRRKKAAMDCLTQALDRMPIRTRQVERCIVKLLKALEKDRTHTLRQYKNLLNLNTREALHEKKIILDHLVTLNRAANQSIAMLDRSPVLVEKLKNKIIAFWHQLRNVPLNEPIVRESELKSIEKFEEEVAQRKIERERQRLDEQEAVQERRQQQQQESSSSSSSVVVDKTPDESSTSSSSSKMDGPNEKSNQHDSKEAQISQSVTSKPAAETSEISSTSSFAMPQHLPLQAPNDGQVNLQTAEQMGEHGGPSHYQIDSAGFSNLKADSPYHELSYSVRHEPIGARTRLGFSTFLVGSCAAVVLLAFLGVKYYGKNSTRAYRRQGFAEVGRSCPEEKTVTNMQFNGYENPAYKFFEAEA